MQLPWGPEDITHIKEVLSQELNNPANGCLLSQFRVLDVCGAQDRVRRNIANSICAIERKYGWSIQSERCFDISRAIELGC